MTRIPQKSSKWPKQPQNLKKKKMIIIPRKDQNTPKITKIVKTILKNKKWPKCPSNTKITKLPLKSLNNLKTSKTTKIPPKPLK